MKKIIIVLFVFAIASSYGQENEFNKKHDLLLNFGLSHSSNWKNNMSLPMKGIGTQIRLHHCLLILWLLHFIILQVLHTDIIFEIFFPLIFL